MTDKGYFLVLSSGFCGSLWLAAQLDKHPEISCTSNGFIGLAMPHDSGTDFSAVDPAHWDHIQSQLDVATPDKLLAKVEARKVARAVGDVHGFRVESYLTAKDEIHRPVVVQHLVRHPVTLLERMALEHAHRFQSFPRIAEAMVQKLPVAAPQLSHVFSGIPLDYNSIRFVALFYAVRDLIRVLQEITRTPDIPLVAFEQVIGSPDAFSSLVGTLSGGLVEADETYLGHVFSPDSLENSGRYRRSAVSHRVGAAEQYAKWTPAEQQVFQRLLTSYRLEERYAAAGYDFSFGDFP
jgi:hypothetical protein